MTHTTSLLQKHDIINDTKGQVLSFPLFNLHPDFYIPVLSSTNSYMLSVYLYFIGVLISTSSYMLSAY